MPIIVPDRLPAKEVLERENVFTMGKKRGLKQDIRVLKLLLVNLMPLKIDTETQILRVLSNTPLQIELDLLRPATHESKHTPQKHLEIFYKTFSDIKASRFDGLIITGAPVECLQFEDVDYWEELQTIMEWSVTHVTSTLHICWAAQAGLYFHYGVNKFPVTQKVFGVFPHRVLQRQSPLLRGFDDTFWAPHSRHTEIRAADIAEVSDLEILSLSDAAGVYIVASKDGSKVFVTGHSEYDQDTLQKEYERDIKKGLSIKVPQNYFPSDNPKNSPLFNWRSHAFLLYSNWLNYYVYQMTPYHWV